MRSTNLLLLFLFQVCFSANAQELVNAPQSKKLSFAQKLASEKRYGDAIVILNSISQTSDTIEFYKAKYLFAENKNHEAKALFLKLIESESVMAGSARLFYNHIGLLSYADSLTGLNNDTNKYHHELFRIQKLAFFLLHKKPKEFIKEFESYKCRYTDLAMIEFNLYLSYNEMIYTKKKIPFLSGLFSAIIPGSGKIYSGKPHESLNAFLPVAFNYAQSIEGFAKEKFNSPHFYVFGTIGSVFYLSNITGSVNSAKRFNKESEQKIKNRIYLELEKLTAKY